MVMAHLMMMPSAMMHHHGHEAVSTAAPMDNAMAGWNLMTCALVLAIIELLFAAAVVFFRTRSMPAIIGDSAANPGQAQSLGVQDRMSAKCHLASVA